MIEFNKIYLGDCLRFMRELPDKSIDLVLTDPPYGIDEAAGRNKKRGGFTHFGGGTGTFIKATDFGYSEWDNSIPSAEHFNELFRNLLL